MLAGKKGKGEGEGEGEGEKEGDTADKKKEIGEEMEVLG